MQTIKKVILVVICLVVLLTSFVFSGAALQLPGGELPDMPYEDMLAMFDPYAVTPLIEAQYAFYPSNDFGFNDLILTSNEFIFAENLPFGSNTAVVSCKQFNGAVCLFFLDSTKQTIFAQRWNANNGQCAVEILSYSPIYRIAYSPWTGLAVSFGGQIGLTNQGVTVSSSSNTNTTYHYAYTFGPYDYYFTVSDNFFDNSSLTKIVDGYGYDCIAGDDYGVGIYPTLSEKQNELIKEGNETSKNIFNTLGNVWDSIKELPSLIADSIKGFFTSLGDRISGFFSSIGDRISGFFGSLGDRISGFFESLKNYLLYFNDTKPEHVNPFSDILTDVKTFFNDQISDVGDFKNSLSSTLNNVVTYIETGSGVVNTFLTAVPMLSAFITFFVVFCIVRKVIGR